MPALQKRDDWFKEISRRNIETSRVMQMELAKRRTLLNGKNYEPPKVPNLPGNMGPAKINKIFSIMIRR